MVIDIDFNMVLVDNLNRLIVGIIKANNFIFNIDSYVAVDDKVAQNFVVCGNSIFKLYFQVFEGNFDIFRCKIHNRNI